MTFLKQGRAELVNQHSDARQQIAATLRQCESRSEASSRARVAIIKFVATTVIGRKPGESCLLSLQDDRNSPAAAGQENGMRKPNGFLNDGQPCSLKRATP